MGTRQRWILKSATWTRCRGGGGTPFLPLVRGFLSPDPHLPRQVRRSRLLRALKRRNSALPQRPAGANRVGLSPRPVRKEGTSSESPALPAQGGGAWDLLCGTWRDEKQLTESCRAGGWFPTLGVPLTCSSLLLAQKFPACHYALRVSQTTEGESVNGHAMWQENAGGQISDHIRIGISASSHGFEPTAPPPSRAGATKWQAQEGPEPLIRPPFICFIFSHSSLTNPFVLPSSGPLPKTPAHQV